MSSRIPKRPAVPASEAESPDPQFQPSGSIVGDLMQTFFQWVSTVWVEQEPVPTSPEDLAQFDLASLIPEYHAYIASGGKWIRSMALPWNRLGLAANWWSGSRWCVW